jgi:hypothetical protein
MSGIDQLLAKAVDPTKVRPDPEHAIYTIPHTWGVYEILSTDCGPSGRRFRKGNHPVRLHELTREFENVRLVALFTEEGLARQLAYELTNAI